jgi:secreted trypsin-like serine protease
MVSLRNKRFDSHFCDGFLIYDQFVLTAAHCLDDKLPNSIAVVVGSHELDYYDYNQEFFVEQVAIHEMYDSVNILYDIGIIKLTEKVTFSDTISPICLPESANDANKIYGERVVLAGWGRIDKDTSNILAVSLQEAVLQIKNGEYPCYERDYDSDIIYCAIDPIPDENSNACNGDSGSPLFVKINNRWYAYGITSYITGVNADNNEVICLPSDPSFYTKIPLYLNWIAWKINLLQTVL